MAEIDDFNIETLAHFSPPGKPDPPQCAPRLGWLAEV
jgi:hypothetical protein